MVLSLEQGQLYLYLYEIPSIMAAILISLLSNSLQFREMTYNHTVLSLIFSQYHFISFICCEIVFLI